MADIHVQRQDDDTFAVEVVEGGSRSRHRVTMTSEHVRRYAAGADPERLLEESFRFLLEREPKESILGAFELPVIERYFPEFRSEIGSRLP